MAEFVRLRRDVDEEGGEQEQRFDGRKRRRKYVDVPRGESAESEGHEDAEEREDGFGQGDWAPNEGVEVGFQVRQGDGRSAQ